MANALLLLTAVLAAGAAAVLARSALRHWWAGRAGRPYELPADHVGTALRSTGAAMAASVALGAGLCAGSGGAGPAHMSAGPSAVRAPAPLLPAPAPAPVPAGGPPRTVAHFAGGVLQRFADGTRVWLPPQYGYAGAADLDFPLVVAYLTGQPARDVIAGFAAQARAGLADPFVVILPAHCGASPPVDVARHYRIAPRRTARGLLGLGDQAPCAVREALGHPNRYRAAAGVAGTYDDLKLPGASGPRTHLLLATPSGDSADAASALRLRDELGRPADVRIVDGIRPLRRLLALIAGYFTEQLDGPNHP